MKVTQSGPNQVSNKPSTEAQSARKSGKAGVSGDAAATSSAAPSSAGVIDPGAARTEISSRAKDFAQAKAVANEAPDAREDKIADLKRRIAAGNYEIDHNGIADRMVDDHLMAGIG